MGTARELAPLGECEHSGGRFWNSCSLLAYVFWHAPRSSNDLAAYEEALAAFHQSLDRADIPGFHGSHAYLVQGVAWFPSSVVYEDWYLVDDFTALGELNVAAVSGHRQRTHEDVAVIAGEGAAGIYALRQGAARLGDSRCAAWYDKTAGLPYDEFFARLGERRTLWQRQMVLGPTPEFCSLDDDVPPADAVTVTRVRTIATSAS
jgi:hypothetical protein